MLKPIPVIALLALTASAQNVSPRIVSRPEPQYTEQARSQYVSGSVLVKITIGAEGAVQNVEVVRPLGFGLDQKAVEAARSWKFVPGTKAGVPVPAVANVAINFRLNATSGGTPGHDLWRGSQMTFENGDASGPYVTATSPAVHGQPDANGSASFEFTVADAGHASQIRVLHASDPAAADEIAKQLATWKFGYADKPDIPAGAVGRVRFVLNAGDGNAGDGNAAKPLLTPAK